MSIDIAAEIVTSRLVQLAVLQARKNLLAPNNEQLIAEAQRLVRYREYMASPEVVNPSDDCSSAYLASEIRFDPILMPRLRSLHHDTRNTTMECEIKDLYPMWSWDHISAVLEYMRNGKEFD